VRLGRRLRAAWAEVVAAATDLGWASVRAVRDPLPRALHDPECDKFKIRGIHETDYALVG